VLVFVARVCAIIPVVALLVHCTALCTTTALSTLSRTLCAQVLVAYSYWLRDQPAKATAVFASAAAAFRSELVLLWAPLMLVSHARGVLCVKRVVGMGVAATVVTALLSMGVDSIFWRKPVWPELQVPRLA
jgi:glycosyl transferase family 22 (putative mannosyltransferase)